MKQPYYVDKPVSFDNSTGMADCGISALERRYSDMRGMYLDEEARKMLEASGDAIIYRFYDLGIPEKASDLAYGTSIIHPGKVGMEFHMTNGHFHTILDTAEIYQCQKGHGLMMMENPEGDTIFKEMYPGMTIYVPPRYAHRSINLSLDETLITFYVFRADAGHNYGSIKEKGFRKLVVSNGESWKVIDNPRWKQGGSL